MSRNQKNLPPFWLVWKPEGRAPCFRHASRQLAQAEADRLARSNPGVEFYVLEPRSVAKSVDIQVTEFAVDDDIPF